MRLMKQQQELQALQQKLSDELASENQKTACSYVILSIHS